MAWTAPDLRSGSPIASGNVVWNVDFEGGHLWGFDQNTGAMVARARIGLAEHFVSLAAAGGKLIVPVHDRLLTCKTQ